MRFKNKLAGILFILSLITAFLSMPVSGALSSGKLDRATAAWVARDNNAMLQLTGLNNQTYNLDNKYSNIGSIINNTNRTIKLTVTITVDFGGLVNRNCVFGIKIGDTLSEINNIGNPPTVIIITLAPWQSVNIQAMLDRNQNNMVAAAFGFSAVDSQGSFSIQMGDSGNSPRKLNCY